MYKLRYFFDAGSGICLWAANDASRSTWGYPVDVDVIGLPETVCKQAYDTLTFYDTCINWSSPGDPSPWTEVDRQALNVSAQSLLRSLRSALGDSFEIVDESKTSNAA
jgi:hypothetical protein